MDFERKFNFLKKTCEYSYMGPLRITNLKYASHDQEIQSFGGVLPQTGDFR
jgi:hypothetical protein